MKFNVTEGEKYQKIVEVEIPAEETELPIKSACRRLAQKVNIPGFRPGKAPRSVLESFLGMDAIMDEVSDDLLPKAYVEALKETGIEPCTQPQVEVVQLTAGQPIKYKFTVTVKPEVKLGQYKGLEITRKIIEVEDIFKFSFISISIFIINYSKSLHKIIMKISIIFISVRMIIYSFSFIFSIFKFSVIF